MMSAAEFVCQRELLGLPIKWLAENMGVSVRSIHRWESGATPIPDWAEQRLRAYMENTERAIGWATVQVLNDVRLSHTTFRHDGVTEMPASWHRMVAARAAERTGREIRWAEDAEQAAQ